MGGSSGGSPVKYKAMPSEDMEMTEKQADNPPPEVKVEPDTGDKKAEEKSPDKSEDKNEELLSSPKESPRKTSFTKSKRRSSKGKTKGRFQVKIADPNDQGSSGTGSGTGSGTDSPCEGEDGSISPLKKAMRKVSTPKKGRFHVKTLREKPRHRNSSVENGEMSPGIDREGLETSYDADAKNQMTVEAIPQLAYYRNEQTKSAIAKQRPTLKELHAPKVSI